ncbi:MAG: hypothetical protein ACXW2I_16240 [Burkholderiales bacterium]
MNDAPSRTRPAYLQRLAQFAALTTLDALSEAAREGARWVLADCIPVIGAGMQQGEMKQFVERHLAQAAPGEAWVIGAGRRAPERASAWNVWRHRCGHRRRAAEEIQLAAHARAHQRGRDDGYGDEPPDAASKRS